METEKQPKTYDLDIVRFSQQVNSLRGRLLTLLDQTASTSTNFIPIACKELGVASEELEVAMEELQRQNELLTKALQTAQVERKRYQELFESSPEAYLITNLQGGIKEANHAACQLLNIPAKFILGKPITVFIHESHRSILLAALIRQQRNLEQGMAASSSVNSSASPFGGISHSQMQNLDLYLVPREHNPLSALCTITPVHDLAGQVVALRWMLKTHPVTGDWSTTSSPAASPSQETETISLLRDRPICNFSRGELISLEPQSLWFVSEGLVKITTLTEHNEEVLIGLVGPGLPFGTSLTSLPLYEAIAFSNVKLVSVPLAEITASPSLQQAFHTVLQRRLQHNEKFMAVLRQRRIYNRLYQLFQLLKDEVGQPTAQGTRLNVYLTHEDLANRPPA